MCRDKMNPLKSHAITLCIFMVLILLMHAMASIAQEVVLSSEPFTVEQIIELKKSGVADTTLIKQIERYKVDFNELTTGDIRALIKVGAGDDLIDAIENNPYEPIVIESPCEDEECGATVKVSGTARIIPDKHLWLFAHRRGLALWWPQSGEIIVEENGEWEQGAFLGQSQDIGFRFEIIVMWISETLHEQMENYLAKCEDTGKYPGIRLPEGSPFAKVTVKKVRH